MNPLIRAEDLMAWQADAAVDLLVVDCSFDLADPAAGARGHAAAHVPGAVYLHLDDDLSAAKTGTNGRHPLPERSVFGATLAAIGVTPATRVVAYDASGGAYAARLWWMLRWIGHERAHVLDGGLAAWRAAGGPLQAGAPATRRAAPAPARADMLSPAMATLDYADLRAAVGSARWLVVDGRAADRFRGENETIDPVAGHIPGAVNRCFRDNLAADERFKPVEQLRAEWLALIGARSPAELVHHCGSGVTACHNLLALAAAGLDGGRLYPGSWSEWCAQPDALVALGD